MYKRLATIFAFALLLGAPLVFAQEINSATVSPAGEMPKREVLSTQGAIKTISEGKISVAGNGAYKEIVLNIQDSTYILSGIDGTPISFAGLKPGDAVTAYYGSAVTRSIPPQGNAIALIVGKPEKSSAGMYLKVAEVQQAQDGSVRVLCTNADRLVTISPDVFAYPQEIKEGSELIVWYDIMTMSLPGQAKATKAMLLAKKADIRVHTLAGVIVVNKKELALHEADTIRSADNTVMLPLRTIAESLGYKVVWYEDTKTAELRKGSETLTVTIGSKSYGKLRMAVQLQHAPELVNGKALVPVEFFTDLMKLTVAVSNSHV